MLKMEKIMIEGHGFDGFQVSTEKANILMIKASNGFLGCGYFNVETANKLQEKVGIVTGVKNFDDMLKAKIIACSEAAKEVGICEGMSGLEALMKMS
jgi:uncharacterized protein YunC (DUF1805 family)